MGTLSINHIQEDSALINAIALKDKKVFEIIYKTHYQQLFSIAYRYAGAQEAAEEIVHDVFLTIWNKAEDLKIQHSLKSYLFKAVINTSLNYIKKEKLNTEKRLKYMAEQQEYDYDGSPNNTEEALLIGLEQALKSLPEKCKNVMYLSRFGKLKQQEIAEQMNISIKTVKNHLTYGFQKLREHLEKHKESIVLLIILFRIKL
jgi:RNA polymerase sigma-70 factor (family 1)